jgi:hypothetical protein
MTLSEMKRLKALEEENARLKRIVAQQALDNELLREINAKEGEPSRPPFDGGVPGQWRQVLTAAVLPAGGDVAVGGGISCQETP